MNSVATTKLQRIRSFLKSQKYTGLVFMRQDNFAWLTTGGSNRVIIPSAEGAAALVVTREHVYLVAHAMDGQRIMDEELSNLPQAEHVALHWYESSVLEKAVQLAGSHPAADVSCRAAFVLEEIYDLHYPLFECEIDTLRQAGAIADLVLSQIAQAITPDTSEKEVARLLADQFSQADMVCDVILVGGETRVGRYRHPTPSDAAIGKHVLITPSVALRGLHCNIARTVYFGDTLPEHIRDAYQAVCAASAASTSLCAPGTSYKDILHAYQNALTEHGFAEEWRGHFPGGRTGYVVCQPGFSLDEERKTGPGEAFEWFATVPGAKIAELIISDGHNVYNASNAGNWPMRNIHVNEKEIILPEILMR